ncbi:MAG: hypothetical protein H6739_42570 [Alphaproteobacteria bacterium]|nr:hypothetical protein [Alphaproteobacteria bacterium]
MILLALLACSSAPAEDPLAAALSAGGSPEACAALDFEEMAITCYVSVAAAAGARGDDATAWTACDAVAPGLWREECHFRSGEELGRAGHTDRALRHCAEAGQYARFCLTHTAWGLPPLPGLTQTDPPERIRAAMDEFAGVVAAGLAKAPESISAEGVDALVARAWFQLYYGAGQADPAAAKAAPADQAPAARTAFSFEAARLLLEAGVPAEQIPARVVEAWTSGAALPTGSTIPHRQRVGRHASAVLPDGTRELARVATFGGGQRLVSDDPRTDIEIATLEGLFFQDPVRPHAFEPWLFDERPLVRWTATKVFVLAGGLDHRPELAAETADGVQRGFIGLAAGEMKRGHRGSGGPKGPPPEGAR